LIALRSRPGKGPIGRETIVESLSVNLDFEKGVELRLAFVYNRIKHHQTGWLGRQDSNLGMAESKSAALPLGYAPMPSDWRRPPGPAAAT
jgi:hypothetical protein